MRKRGKHERSRYGETIGYLMNRYGCLYDPNVDALIWDDEYTTAEPGSWVWRPECDEWRRKTV